MTVCPQCGAIIPHDATLGGLCPQCLLSRGTKKTQPNEKISLRASAS
jgi:NMD protein affecting ribosome stability and mRNA decay